MLSRDGPRERTYLGDIIRAVLSWDPCLYHAYVDCPDGSWGCLWGVAGDRERVWPLFDVLADVKSGAFGLVVAP